MTLIEFNELNLNERYRFLFTNRSNDPVKFNCLRDDAEYKYSLWDCGDFFVKMKYSKSQKKVINIEGIPPNDSRIDLYIDFAINSID